MSLQYHIYVRFLSSKNRHLKAFVSQQQCFLYCSRLRSSEAASLHLHEQVRRVLNLSRWLIET